MIQARTNGWWSGAPDAAKQLKMHDAVILAAIILYSTLAIYLFLVADLILFRRNHLASYAFNKPTANLNFLLSSPLFQPLLS